MKTLLLDLETRPSMGYVWSLWDQNVSLSQLVEVGEVICFGAKWLGSKKIHFKSIYHHSKKEMLDSAWKLMNEADAIIHYNGRAFDIKHLNREFLLAEMAPPSPHKDIDLLTVARGRFKFVSNKLEHVATQLGLGGKTSHEGFQLWVDCMKNDKTAWSKMKEYCINDVLLTEQVYEKLLPWIKTHPSIPLYDGVEDLACKNCGSTNIQRRGYAYTNVSRFPKFLCKNCNTWGRGRKSDMVTELRHIV